MTFTFYAKSVTPVGPVDAVRAASLLRGRYLHAPFTGNSQEFKENGYSSRAYVSLAP